MVILKSASLYVYSRPLCKLMLAISSRCFAFSEIITFFLLFVLHLSAFYKIKFQVCYCLLNCRNWKKEKLCCAIILFHSIISHNLRRSSGHHRRIRNNPFPYCPVFSFRFLTRVRSSSYSPIAAWIFVLTSSLVTWSLNEMFDSLR